MTAILSIMTGALMTVMYQAQHSYRSQEDLMEVTQTARVAMNQITRYLRQAGNDPLESAFAIATPVQIQGSGHITINSDITGSVASTTGNSKESTGDPDGILDSIYEQVEVRYDSGSEQLLIDIGYGEQVLAENVSGLTLTYFDLDGNETTNPDAIAKVKVELVAETEDPDQRTGNVSSLTLVSEVFIRSQSFDPFAL